KAQTSQQSNIRRAEPPVPNEVQNYDVLGHMLAIHQDEWLRLRQQIKAAQQHLEHLRPEGRERIARLTAQASEVREKINKIATEMDRAEWDGERELSPEP
ncbi:hypothetical protein OC835_000894, partial [Tilletia horrida]